MSLLIAGTFAIAVLYSSVGHAGASGYIALMTLFGLAPAAIRPTALTLNILVASIATWHFVRAGHFQWRLFWPFVVLAVPAAFIGGAIVLPVKAFNMLLGVVLLYSAFHFARSAASASDSACTWRTVCSMAIRRAPWRASWSEMALWLDTSVPDTSSMRKSMWLNLPTISWLTAWIRFSSPDR